MTLYLYQVLSPANFFHIPNVYYAIHKKSNSTDEQAVIYYELTTPHGQKEHLLL